MSIAFPTRDPTRSSSESETSRGHILEFYASELRLRGDAPIVQPHVEGGDVLCWNGEVRQSVVNIWTPSESVLIALHPCCHSYRFSKV